MQRSLTSRVVAVSLWGFSLLQLSGCGKPVPGNARSADVRNRLARLEQVEMTFDARNLSSQKKELLRTLLEAGRLVHEAYLHQVDPRGVTIRDSLIQRTDDAGRDMLRLIIRNGGRFDKMDHYVNFFDAETRPPGAAFYPPDLSRGDFEQYVSMHPENAEVFRSPYTVIERRGDDLVAMPFHKAYREWIVPAAALLKKAASIAENVSLRNFLKSRADALLTDDYFQSDLAWIDLKDPDVDLLLAPDEVYDDALMGLKASYEVSVMIKDAEGSAQLGVFSRHLNELEQHLPLEAKYKRVVSGLSSPMEVVVDIYRGGDIATGYQAVAATLPNDPEVQSAKGTKKIFWKNLMDARVNRVILPMGRELIASDQIQYITPQGVFDDVLMHEICHSIGPVYVHGTENSVPVNQALKDHYTAIEEAKADIAGLYSMKYFVDNGIVGKEMERIHAVSALASIFRTIRFGTSEAHGKAAMCELNYFQERGAFYFNPVTKKWSVVFEKLPAAVRDLARELLMLEATGDYEGAEKFFKRWSNMPLEVEQSLQRLSHVPVDIEPVYHIRWE